MKVVNYNDCISHIEKKYKIKTRGYKHKKFKGVYFDYWHSILDLYSDEIKNPCEVKINLSKIVNDGDCIKPETLIFMATQLKRIKDRNPELVPDLIEHFSDSMIVARRDWREIITNHIREDFSDYIVNDEILFYIEW